MVCLNIEFVSFLGDTIALYTLFSLSFTALRVRWDDLGFKRFW